MPIYEVEFYDEQQRVRTARVECDEEKLIPFKLTQDAGSSAG
jgi:hypothetical protein